MKRFILSHLATALFAGLAGGFIVKFFDSSGYNRLASKAGQTLADLARALEAEKIQTGFYPDSLADLEVESESPEFSRELLGKVHYFATMDGYVALVGLPGVATIRPGEGPRFSFDAVPEAR